MKRNYRLAFFIAFLAAIAIAGCSKPKGDLSGSVTYKGKNVLSGTVTVYDSDRKAYQGAIDQGQYSVKGVPAGQVTLIVVSVDPNAEMAMPGGGAGPAEGKGRTGGRETKGPEGTPPPPKVVGWFPIPRKYEDISSTDLKTEVKAGPNTYDIQLKD